MTLAAPVALTGPAFALPASPAAEPSGTAPGTTTPTQGEEWVIEYEKKGDRQGTEVLFTGPDDGWVIGLDDDQEPVGLPFVSHWDGQQWSEVDAAELSELTENKLRRSTAAASARTTSGRPAVTALRRRRRGLRAGALGRRVLDFLRRPENRRE